MSNEVKLQLEEGQIINAIAVVIAEAFSPERRDALIRDILRSHLAMPADRYGKETMFSATVNKALQGMVEEQLKVEVEGLRPDVECIVSEYFGSSLREGLVKQIEKAITEGFAKGINIAVGQRY